MLVHFHLEKTAGSSLRSAGIKYFGKEDSITVYGEDIRTTTKVAGQIYFRDKDEVHHRERAKRLANYLNETRPRFFSSHLIKTIRPHLTPDAATVAIFRDPIDRIISNYNFSRMMRRFSGSFEEFYRLPRFQNVQAKHFRFEDVDQLTIVGLTREYPKTLERLNARLGLDLKHSKKNKTPFFFKQMKRESLSAATLAEVTALNEDDMAVFAYAEDRFRHNG